MNHGLWTKSTKIPTGDYFLVLNKSRYSRYGHCSCIDGRVDKPKLSALKTKTVLTPREAEVMQHVKNGLRNKDIASELNISTETVKKHLQNIFVKLNADNKIQAINKFFAQD